MTAASPATSPTGPASPCIGLCRIAPESGLCLGCHRTLDEIAAWAGLSEDERRAIMAGLADRDPSVVWPCI